RIERGRRLERLCNDRNPTAAHILRRGAHAILSRRKPVQSILATIVRRNGSNHGFGSFTINVHGSQCPYLRAPDRFTITIDDATGNRTGLCHGESNACNLLAGSKINQQSPPGGSTLTILSWQVPAFSRSN